MRKNIGSCIDPNPLRVERQDPDNFPRLQTRKRCALEIAAYVFKMKRMLAFEKRYLRRNSTSVISTCHGLLFLSRLFSFLCLPEWTNAMLAAILFRAND